MQNKEPENLTEVTFPGFIFGKWHKTIQIEPPKYIGRIQTCACQIREVENFPFLYTFIIMLHCFWKSIKIVYFHCECQIYKTMLNSNNQQKKWEKACICHFLGLIWDMYSMWIPTHIITAFRGSLVKKPCKIPYWVFTKVKNELKRSKNL